MHLRWVTKYSQVDGLLQVPHQHNTRPRFSLNTDFISRRLEGGTASVNKRLAAVRKMVARMDSEFFELKILIWVSSRLLDDLAKDMRHRDRVGAEIEMVAAKLDWH